MGHDGRLETTPLAMVVGLATLPPHRARAHKCEKGFEVASGAC